MLFEFLFISHQNFQVCLDFFEILLGLFADCFLMVTEDGHLLIGLVVSVHLHLHREAV